MPSPACLEEIGRSCYITGRQSDVCQSHVYRFPRRLLGCELSPAALIILNNHTPWVDSPRRKRQSRSCEEPAGHSAQSSRWSVSLFLRQSHRAANPRMRPSLEQEILPLLKARCQKCHGPVKPKGEAQPEQCSFAGTRGRERAGDSYRVSWTKA